MSLKRLKRRLSLTFRGSRGVDESLSELAESLAIEENGGIKENGRYPFLLVFISTMFTSTGWDSPRNECVAIVYKI